MSDQKIRRVGDNGSVTLAKDGDRLVTRAEFHQLSEIPPEAEWFANITNPYTRWAYRNDVNSFMEFTGIQKSEEFRQVARGHVIACRDQLVNKKLAPATIRSTVSNDTVMAQAKVKHPTLGTWKK